MSDTNTSIAHGLTVPTGTQIYDSLMAKIEPELVSANLAGLDAKYAQENPPERAVRYARYSKAFAAYDIAYHSWVTEFSLASQTFRRRALRSAEEKSRADEHSILQSIGSALDASESSTKD